jgi:hypothetical protein
MQVCLRNRERARVEDRVWALGEGPLGMVELSLPAAAGLYTSKTGLASEPVPCFRSYEIQCLVLGGDTAAEI